MSGLGLVFETETHQLTIDWLTKACTEFAAGNNETIAKFTDFVYNESESNDRVTVHDVYVESETESWSYQISRFANETWMVVET